MDLEPRVKDDFGKKMPRNKKLVRLAKKNLAFFVDI